MAVPEQLDHHRSAPALNNDGAEPAPKRRKNIHSRVWSSKNGQIGEDNVAKSILARENQHKTIAQVRNAVEKPAASFATLGVAAWLVASLAALSVKHPTTIQQTAIPKLLSGQSVIGSSKTGSGKTVAFAVPILQKWSEDPTGTFAVIFTPTRELALQIYEQFKAIGAPQGVKVLLVTGGGDMLTEAVSLARRPHIVVATPGRLADHVKTSGADTVRGFSKTRFVVLDEADRLLAAGHGSMLPDVETCLSVLPPSADRQTCLFTATLTPEVTALRDMHTGQDRPAVAVCEVPYEDLAVPSTLRQTYIQTPVTQRESYLHALLSTPANINKSIIVFANSKKTANFLHHLLSLLEYKVAALHSGLSQPQRVANLAQFRAQTARILIATDVASRGLDIQQVQIVINYDLPRDPDSYIHRVGRTARMGRKGQSIAFVGQRDVLLLLAIEERIGSKMDAYAESGVKLEDKVIEEALNRVGEKKREALLQIDEGRDAAGHRHNNKLEPIQR